MKTLVIYEPYGGIIEYFSSINKAFNRYKESFYFEKISYAAFKKQIENDEFKNNDVSIYKAILR